MATKIWDEIGYNSACIRDIREIFVYISFWGACYCMMPVKFYHKHPAMGCRVDVAAGLNT